MTAIRVSTLVVGFGLWTLPAIAPAQSTAATGAPVGPAGSSNNASAVQSPGANWTTASDQAPASNASSPAITPPGPSGPATTGTAATNSSVAPAAPALPSSSLIEPPAPQAPSKSDEPPTLFGQKSLKVGGYGSLMMQYARLNGRDGALGGVEGALLLDHRFAIGFAAFGWSNEQRLTASQNYERPYMHFGFGGLLLRYHVYIPDSPVLISAAALVGGGGVSLTQFQDSEVLRENTDVFFIFEPQIGVHVNLTRWMRVGLDAGYRITSGIGRFGFDESNFNGISVGGSVGFGWF